MFLPRSTWSDPSHEEWTASANLRASAKEILTALTDPEAIAGWAPVTFEVQGIAGGRLEAGSRERVTGSLAGIRVAFDVEVFRGDLERLELTARGPVELHVVYRFLAHDDGVFVEATVSMDRSQGLTAHVLRGAVAAVLGAGALDTALGRLAASLASRSEPELVAA